MHCRLSLLFAEDFVLDLIVVGVTLAFFTACGLYAYALERL